MINFTQFYLLEKIRRLLLIILLSIGFFLVFLKPLPVLAQTQKPPQTCYIGVYLLALDNFNLLDKTFDTNFWIWSICPTSEFKPLKNLEVINAKNLDIINSNSVEKKDKLNLFSKGDKVYFDQAKIGATMSFNWDTTNYPFDRHILTIPLEETVYNTSEFIYTPDLKNSTYKDDLTLIGWQINRFEVTTVENTYNTTFGDTEMDSNFSKFSQLLIQISIERKSFLGFLKLTAGVYMAVLISFLSFFLKSGEEIGSRSGLLVGCLFATLVNMQVTDSILGSAPHLILVDKIHITTIFYIAIATLVSIYSHIIDQKGDTDKAIWLDRKVCFPLFTISFIIFNLVIIYNAIQTG